MSSAPPRVAIRFDVPWTHPSWVLEDATVPESGPQDNATRTMDSTCAGVAWVFDPQRLGPDDDGGPWTLEMAEEGRAFGAETRAPASMDGIHQGEVDRLDGVALWFLKRAVDSFDAAHEADPSTPRLQLRALRGVPGCGTRKKKPAAQPAPTPTPTPR